MNDLLSTSEAAQILEVTSQTVLNWVRKGHFTVTHKTGRYFFDRGEIETVAEYRQNLAVALGEFTAGWSKSDWTEDHERRFGYFAKEFVGLLTEIEISNILIQVKESK